MPELALAAVQVRLAVHNFESPGAFRRLIDEHAARAADATSGADHRLMVFPEGVGHFLPLASGPTALLGKATLAEAFAGLAVRHPLRVLRGMIEAGSPRLDRGVLHAVLPAADKIMKEVFARVARRHRATVVAGSHLVARAGGRITNTSYTFGPDGRLLGETDKVNLVPALEDRSPGGLGLSRGDPEGVPVCQVRWGSLATLICYDGFREPHTRTERWALMGPRVDAAGVDVIANPAANPWPWNQPWVHAEPGETLTRGEQWAAEGLPATLATLRRARFGVTAHLCGAVMDHHFEGRSEVLERRGSEVAVLARAASLDQAEVVVAAVEVGRALSGAGVTAAAAQQKLVD